MGERCQGSDAVRTWGIAGEPSTKGWPTDKSVKLLGSEHGRVDGDEQVSDRICYQISSCLRPLFKGCRLICAIKQGRKAPPATKNQTHPCCHQKVTRKGLCLTWIRMQPHVHDLGLHAQYSVVVFAKRRLVRVAIALSRGAWHASLGVTATSGIDLPARLSAGLFRAVDRCGLNSRQINYLQLIASETHYRGSFRQSETPGKSACPAHFSSGPRQNPGPASGQNA